MIKFMIPATPELEKNAYTVFLVKEADENAKKAYKDSNFKAKMKDFFIDYRNKIILIGISDLKDVDDLRTIGSKLSKELESTNIVSLKLDNIDKKHIQHFVEGMILGSYSFTKKAEPKVDKIVSLFFSAKLSQKVNAAYTIAENQNNARDILSDSPTDMNPEKITKIIKSTVSDNLSIKIYGQKDLEKFGMNALLAVNRASCYKPRVVKLEYIPEGGNFDKHIIVCGKGVTYDTGGLNIKTDSYMLDMKTDKAGAIVSYAAIKSIAELKESKNKVTVYLGFVENAIGPNAYKPDDILVAANGTTIEIKNTDAEGRLVLFDLLCLAQKQNKDFSSIYTIATLTGAMERSFGPGVAATVSLNAKIQSEFKKIAEKSGEIFVNTEIHKFLLDSVKGENADIANIGNCSPNAGCQTAGLFLTYAIDSENKEKFCHLDIAGPTRSKGISCYKKGVTGFGVSSLVNLFTK